MSSSRLKLEKFRIPLEEIIRATNNFSSQTQIGGGGFGMVHKGQLSEDWQNRTVAIKRLDRNGYQGSNEFHNELEMVSSFQHPNIIPFIGFCEEANELIIIFEYASNGSLDHHIRDPDKRRLLTWGQRLKICLGAARGLNYLHSGVGEYKRVIHRDMKSANILLDENMEAKICDFGLSRYGPRNQIHTKIITRASGTKFYIDPIYNEREILQKESDIYSFGMVMFELSSGMLAYCKRCFRGGNPESLINLVRSYYDDDDGKRVDGGLDKLMDPDISGDIKWSSFITFNRIAHQCINIKDIKERPTMDTIIKTIEEALYIQNNDRKIESSSKDPTKDHESYKMMVKGIAVLEKNVATYNNWMEVSDVDTLRIQLITSTHADRTTSVKNLRRKLINPSILEGGIVIHRNASIQDVYEVIFEWDEEMGLPGAFLVESSFQNEVFLMTFTLENVPGYGQVKFFCNSWVYPTNCTKYRIFFANKAYLPSATPAFLRPYREEELASLRGNRTGMLREWDRVYDYALYNDLGNPDDKEKVRPVIGGSSEYPYPRRGRTGRPPTKKDPKTESRLPIFKIYLPRDERTGLEAFPKSFQPILEFLISYYDDEFDLFEDVLKLYNRGFMLPEGYLVHPVPQVIKYDISAWITDEEFAREMLAGVNPVSIQLLRDFPPTSKLDAQLYGNQSSSIRSHHIEDHLDGLEIHTILKDNRLFILDHHDSLMPYVKRINATSSKIYATRTLLLLQTDGTLKPIAIELSLPHPDDDKLGAISRVCTPAKDGVQATIWQLAKTYVAVNDSGIHQLISHWLNTHAVIEPFVIATHRQLSVLHPIHKLLHPHFHNTININFSTRNLLINSGGLLERTLFSGKYSVEMSSKIYNDWVFPNQALPVDLVLRGMAVEDSTFPHGLRLTIKDYPYAVDGLEIWSAIKTWVEDYCKFYYRNDDMVQNDTELQSWWKEVREVGHGDLKHKPWWPTMSSLRDLIDSCTIIIWVSSALHAAVNFGQYHYAGYPPNRPTLSRRLLPEPDTPEYDELEVDPKRAFLKTMNPPLESHLNVILMQMLSTHTSDEIYLGQREYPEWTMDAEPLEAFKKFNKKLKEIETRIVNLNQDERLKNRHGGPVEIPYTLLYPSSEHGLTGMGIPNSVSI